MQCHHTGSQPVPSSGDTLEALIYKGMVPKKRRFLTFFIFEMVPSDPIRPRIGECTNRRVGHEIRGSQVIGHVAHRNIADRPDQAVSAVRGALFKSARNAEVEPTYSGGGTQYHRGCGTGSQSLRSQVHLSSLKQTLQVLRKAHLTQLRR